MKVIDAPVLTSTIERAVFVVCRLGLSLRLTFLSRSQTALVCVYVCHCCVVSSFGCVCKGETISVLRLCLSSKVLWEFLWIATYDFMKHLNSSN